jgi:hypothetical protein
MYQESERESVIHYGATELNSSGRCMPFDALMFWAGLGILLGRNYTIKATHDKLTAWKTDSTLNDVEIRALEQTGAWHRDESSEDESWFSFYPGG